MTKAREVFNAACRLICNGKIPKKKELEEIDQAFIKRWYDSGETDFDLYSDPEYVKTLLYCWSCTSGPHINLCHRFNLLEDTKSAIDFHGGIGMSAVLLGILYPKCTVYNHSVVDEHRKICFELVKEFKLPNVEVVGDLVEADLFIAQETFEHIKDPFSMLRFALDSRVKPKQYLDGTSFTIPGPGHFTNTGYLDGDEAIDFKHAKRRFNEILRSRGFAHFSEVRNIKKPYNGHPWLWEKR